jgi:uncharacterized membrane protein
MQQNPSASPRHLHLCLLGVILLAIILRFHNLEATSLWIDEIYSFMVVNTHWPFPEPGQPIQSAADFCQRHLAWQPMRFDVLLQLLKENVHLPQFYLLLNPWLGLLGNTEFGLRSFAAFFSCLTLLPLYALSAAMSKSQKAGLFATFVAAVVPFQLYFAQEGRMYTLSLFWATLSAWALWKTLNGARPFFWALLYALTVVGGFFSHYFFVFYLAFHVVYALLWLIRNSDWKRFAYLGFAVLALILAAVLWYPIYQAQQHGVSVDYHFAKGLKNPLRYLTALVWQPLVVIAGDNRLERLFYIPITLLLLFCFLLKPGKAGQEEKFSLNREGFLLTWIFIPLLAQITYDMFKQTHTVVVDRYIMLISPAVCMLMGFGLYRLWDSGHRKATACLMSIMVLLGFANTWAPSPFRDEHNKKDIRGKIQWMTHQARPQDLVLVNGPPGAPGLAAWYLSKSKPEQPMLYWMSQADYPTPLPSPDLLKPYQRVWLFRERANNERGLQQVKDYLQRLYPHQTQENDWFIYSR